MLNKGAIDNQFSIDVYPMHFEVLLFVKGKKVKLKGLHPPTYIR